jgi:hypothetical protein
MKTYSIALSLCLLAGCSTTTPDYDNKFGDAVRAARLSMTINPEAGKNPDQVAGMDGNAARETMLRYQDTFKSPPPAINVTNIGGSLTSGAGGGSR